MNRSFITIITAATLLAGVGCNQQAPVNHDPTVTLTPESGKFGISHLSGLSKTTRSAVKEGANVQFNLGKIKGSTGYFFLLYNIGARPITNVTLSIASNAFAVFPSTMDTLIPGSDVGMLPIVKVSAFHGTPLDGIGTRPVLPKGKNDFTLVIKGTTTTSEGKDTLIELQAQMQLEALVMDFTMQLMNQTLNLAQPGLGYDNAFGSVPALANKEFGVFSNYCSSDTLLTIGNTGNTPISVDLYYYTFDKSGAGDAILPTIAFKNTTVISAGSSKIIALNAANLSDGSAISSLFIVSGENTICNPANVFQNVDGKCYYAISHTQTTCEQLSKQDRIGEFQKSLFKSACRQLSLYFGNDSLMFFAEECGGGTSVAYQLYDLQQDPVMLLVSQTGTSPTDLQPLQGDETYRSMFDSIRSNLTHKSSNVKKFGNYLPNSANSYNWWDN